MKPTFGPTNHVDWSFPDPYFNACKYKCWSCFDLPRCACALPQHYCDNFPAHMEIDYVRVYQATDDPHHQLGCSPPSRPTKEWIEDVNHVDWYKLPIQKQPLKPIVTGGAPCTAHEDCGNGTCSADGACQCEMGWVGPMCLAHGGSYDEEGEDVSLPAPGNRNTIGLIDAVLSRPQQ